MYEGILDICGWKSSSGSIFKELALKKKNCKEKNDPTHSRTQS